MDEAPYYATAPLIGLVTLALTTIGSLALAIRYRQPPETVVLAVDTAGAFLWGFDALICLSRGWMPGVIGFGAGCAMCAMFAVFFFRRHRGKRGWARSSGRIIRRGWRLAVVPR